MLWRLVSASHLQLAMSDYIELHCHSYFSLLDGVSSPEALVTRANEQGMKALALTDHNAVYGAVRFAQAAKAAGLQPIFGTELTLDDGHHLTLLVENDTGWKNLCQLISCAQANAPKGQGALPPHALDNHTEGLIALSGCRHSAIGTALLKDDREAALAGTSWLCDRFGRSHTWIEVQHHSRPDDNKLVAEGVSLARQVGLGYVATNNVHYTTREEHHLQDILTCIGHGAALEKSSHIRRPNSEYFLKSASEMVRRFKEIPNALNNTRIVAEQCQFALQDGVQGFPLFSIPCDTDSKTYLRSLCREAAIAHYGEPSEQVWKQLNHEIGVINRSGLVNYFLVVWDVMRFAREQNIMAQGRGSACNSLVAYLLGISPIDPLAHSLVFERFLSDERRVVPDIDIDFPTHRREEVIQYIYSKYGKAHVAMACTYSTYQARGALRVLGIPLQLLNQASRGLDRYSGAALSDSPALQTLAEEAPIWKQLISLAKEIIGIPRHLGLHNGGMVLTDTPLTSRVPTEPAAMINRSIVQWDKDGLEEAGLIKLDILGLRMLSAITEAAHIVEQATGKQLDLYSLPFDDPDVYAMITRADTIGVFQVESRAQAQVLPRLQPTCFNDLVVSISLIRPGPLQGAMVHPYLRRREGEEEIIYAHPLLEPALSETLGVVLFQEQVLKVARDLAGFSAGKGELLRRALGKKHSTKAVEQFQSDFVKGALAKGVSREVAEKVFDQLKAFGSYSFAKSHAAAFSVLVYRSAWLKCHYPAAFAAGILNNQPMGFWSPRIIVEDAKRNGVQVLPLSINSSGVQCEVVEGALRIGLSYVKDMGTAGSQRVIAAREVRPFKDLTDFCRRTRLSRCLTENLIRAGAMDEWGTPRRDLIWSLGTLHYREEAFELEFTDEAVILPELSPTETLAWEHELMGISAGEHLMGLYRPWLTERKIHGSRELQRHPSNRPIRVAGLVAVHQAPPTAKGVHFISIEDENGLLDIVVKPEVYAEFREVWRFSPLLIVEGVVQRRNRVTNILAHNAMQLRLPDSLPY
jgi:error-prone DNA polymerase